MTASRSMLKCIAIVLVLLSGWGGPMCWAGDSDVAQEQEDLFDLSLEELMEMSIDTVYGASKRPQKVSEAPSSVTVITSEEIRLYGYRTLADLLRSVPGFYLAYDQAYHQLLARGFHRPGEFNSPVLLLVDGHRASEDIGIGAALGTEFVLDVDLIDRVEVIRGAQSALYGNKAMLGVINVITKTGRQIEGVELSGEVASSDTTKARLTYGETFDNEMELLVSGTRYNSDGSEVYFEDPDNPGAVPAPARTNDDWFDNVVANFGWGDLKLLLAHTERDKGHPVSPFLPVDDLRVRSAEDTTLMGLTYDTELSEAWTLTGRASYTQYEYDERDGMVIAFGGEEPEPLQAEFSHREDWWHGEMQLVGTPIDRHTVTAGAEFSYKRRRDQARFDGELVIDRSRDGENWGLYLQDEFAVFENTTLVGSLRYDYHDAFGGRFSPRLALIQQLWDETTLKLLYGRGFRAPNGRELLLDDGLSTTKGAGDLDPEIIETYEIVLEHELAAHWRATVSGFYYMMDDLIAQDIDPSDGLLVFQNSSERVEAQGVELALDGRFGRGLQTRTSYAYIDADSDETGEALVRPPSHLAKLNVIAPVVENRLFAGLELQYNGPSETLTGDTADDSVLTNLTLTYRSPSRPLEISVGIYNLLDVSYEQPGFDGGWRSAVEQEGRSFRAKLTYRF